MTRILRWYVCAVCLAIGAPAHSWAQPDAAVSVPQVEEEEIYLDAERVSYERLTETIMASGRVGIRYGTSEFHAEEILIRRDTNEAHARGTVLIDMPEVTLMASEIHLDLDDETGTLEEASIFAPERGFSLYGVRVSKLLGQRYVIEDGHFTTCQCCDGVPSWSVASDSLDITVGGHARITGGTFNILDTPVLYVPNMIFPVMQERQSGFLRPRFSLSNRRGFQVLLPYYWAIDKSQDTTLAVDVETSARIGTIGEYRYVRDRRSDGQLRASFFNETIRGDETRPDGRIISLNRWNVSSAVRQWITEDAYLYADTFLVGDDFFLREINTFSFDYVNAVATRTLPFTASQVGFLYDAGRINVAGEGVYYQDMTDSQRTDDDDPEMTRGSRIDSETVHRTPELRVHGQTLLGGHLLAGFQSSATNFHRNSGVDGLRLDVAPSLLVPLPLGRRVFGNAEVTLRETVYDLRATPEGIRRRSTRELLQVGVGIGSALSRVYAPNFLGLQRVRHTIEPTLQYLYVPPVGQSDMPLFDQIDRINRRSLLSYGVINRFVGKFADDEEGEADTLLAASANAIEGADDVREVAMLWLRQSFDLSQDIDRPQSGQGGERFSDIDLGGQVTPAELLSLRFHLNYDVNSSDVTAASVGFFAQDPGIFSAKRNRQARVDTRTSAGVTYRFLTESALNDAGVDARQVALQVIHSDVVIGLPKGIGLHYANRYDLEADRFLDNYIGFRMASQCDCWAIDLGITDKTNPQELEVSARVTLVGFGGDAPNTLIARRNP